MQGVKNMKNIVEIINSLSNLLPLKPATSIQITDAELQLRISFANEYKEYLAAFGAIMADGIDTNGLIYQKQLSANYTRHEQIWVSPSNKSLTVQT